MSGYILPCRFVAGRGQCAVCGRRFCLMVAEVVVTGLVTGFPGLLYVGGHQMSLRIDDDSMSLEVGGKVVATAQFAQHAAADDRGAWIVSDRPGRLLNRNEAITALTVTELLEIGHRSDHPLVLAFEEELQ